MIATTLKSLVLPFPGYSTYLRKGEEGEKPPLTANTCKTSPETQLWRARRRKPGGKAPIKQGPNSGGHTCFLARTASTRKVGEAGQSNSGPVPLTLPAVSKRDASIHCIRLHARLGGNILQVGRPRVDRGRGDQKRKKGKKPAGGTEMIKKTG